MIELYDFYTKHLLGTVLILVCFLIVRFLIHKKSNILKNMLWIILLLRLLFPFSIYTDWGILSPTTTFDNGIDTTIPKNELPANTPVSVDMESQVEESKNTSDVSASNDIIYQEGPAINIPMIIWYLGVILFFVYYVVSRIHIGKRMKGAGKMPDYDNVYEWQDDFPACVIGVIRPRIYVPCDLKKEQLNVILQHENMHIKRGDYILLLLYYLALALNWYNPLCWAVYFMVRSDIEMACDEQVLRNCSKAERQNYARILVQLCSVKTADKFPLVSFARGKKNIEKRVVNIGENYTYKKWVYAGVGILSVAIVAGGVFLYANADNNSNDINLAQLAQISTEKATEDFGADMPRLGYVEGTYISQDSGKVSISFDWAEKRFSFDYDPLSSYYPAGTIKVEDGVVTATTEDNKYTYIFKIIDNDTICFVQEGSNVVKTVEGETPVIDGTRFTFVEYVLPPKGSIVNEQNPKQAVLEFSQNFINTLNGAIAKTGKVNLGEYIKNKNLLTFAYKMVELTHKQDVAGENMTTYGGNNKFGDSEIEELGEGVYYLYIPFECEGTGMVCQLLVKVLDENMEIVDFYFGSKDGIDTIATGHHTVRKVDDPERWNDEAWVAGVFSNIEDYEKERGIQYNNTEDEEVRLLDVKFYQNGKEINYDEGWYPFGGDDVEIYLIYQGKPNYVEVLSTPTGTNVKDTEELIHREYLYNNTGNYTLKVTKDEIGEGTHYLKVRIYHLDEDVSDDLHVYFE